VACEADMQAKVSLQAAAGLALAGKVPDSKPTRLPQVNASAARPYRGHNSLTLQRNTSPARLLLEEHRPQDSKSRVKRCLVQQMTRSSTLTPSMSHIAGLDKIVELKGLISPPACEFGGKHGNVVTSSRVHTVHKGWRAIAVDGQRLGPAELASALASAQRHSRYTVTFRIGDRDVDGENARGAVGKKDQDVLEQAEQENRAAEAESLRRAAEKVAAEAADRERMALLEARREAAEAEKCVREAREAERQEREVADASQEARRKASEAEKRAREAIEAERQEREIAEAACATQAGEEADRKRRVAEETRRMAQGEMELQSAERARQEAKRRADEEPYRQAADESEQRQMAADEVEKHKAEETERKIAFEQEAARDIVTKRLEKECGLPPRSTIADPHQALMKALSQAKTAVPKKKRGGPCDKCDGPHHEDDCPHFKGKRDKHKDAIDRYGKKGASDNGEGDGHVVLCSARIIPQPGDGSCLFHSVSYGLKSTSATRLRAEIADFIASSPDMLIADNPIKDWVLWDSGLDVKAYAKTMRTGSRWGGAVELAVCAQLKAVAIHIYEKGARGFARISAFGEDTCSKPKLQVVNLHYGGRVHYDALEV